MYKALRIAFALASITFASSAHAEWRRYETAHFIIYSEAGDKRATERAAGLEKIDGLLRMATGLSSDVQPIKVRIYELGDEGQVEDAFGPGGEGVGGFYTSNVLGPFAVTLRRHVAGDAAFTPEYVLHHEYTHHFMLQYFPSDYPLWYAEGFAELIGASKIMDDGRVAYGFPDRYRGDAIAFEWAPLQDVLASPPDKVRPYDVYGQGWAMTHFFTFTKGRTQQLHQYLAALAAGKSPTDAAKVFGDLGALNAQAHAYLMQGSFESKLVNVPIQQPVVQKVAAVSAGEAALIPETVAFKDYDARYIKKDGERQRELARRAALLQRIRTKASQYPNDPYALYLLAEAENLSGSPVAAEAAVDRLLSIQPDNVRGLVRKSLLLSDSASKLSGQARLDRAAQARAFAVRANKLNGDEPLTYVAFYESYHSAGLPVTQNALEGLEAAVEKLPDDTRIRRMLVEEYAVERRWRAAINTLEPIANDPHDSPVREEARQRLAQLEAQLKTESVAAR